MVILEELRRQNNHPSADELYERVRKKLPRISLGTVYRNLYQYDECTSYAVSKDFTLNNAILFHKTRDNRDVPQAVYILKSSLPGINKFIAVSNAT